MDSFRVFIELMEYHLTFIVVDSLVFIRNGISNGYKTECGYIFESNVSNFIYNMHDFISYA